MGKVKLGVVLSGGGARGAYEVGVLRYLAERKIQPQAYAGASIGALNGAVMASAPTVQEGAERLVRLWKSLREEEILQPNFKPTRRMMAFGAGYVMAKRLSPQGETFQATAHEFARHLKPYPDWETYLSYLDEAPLERGLFSNDYLMGVLAEVGAVQADSAPLWISLYPTQGIIQDLGRVLLAEAGIKETMAPVFVKLQDLPLSERMGALMASAALPLAFDAQTVGGQTYRDGGLGGWSKKEGDTPIRPLIDHGCNWCIVVHLSDGSLWSRQDFPGARIIEVRPQQSIHPEGGLESLVNFNPARLESWMQQGYQDAARCVGNVFDTIDLLSKAERAAAARDATIQCLEEDGFEDALRFLPDLGKKS